MMIPMWTTENNKLSSRNLIDEMASMAAKEIQEEIDRDIIRQMISIAEIMKLEKKRKQELVDKYLAGEATCQEIEEAKEIIVEGI